MLRPVLLSGLLAAATPARALAATPAVLPDFEQPPVQYFLVVWVVLIVAAAGLLWYITFERDRRRLVPVEALAPPRVVLRSDCCPFCGHPVQPEISICPFCRERMWT
ncbi:hypothetical protein [Methanosphaerula subterraneus]|uniref:hypothetical protein n=1 Tax=Methanosphaerula subterraneus TaxID=3350244 RepID=UPI003F850F5E